MNEGLRDNVFARLLVAGLRRRDPAWARWVDRMREHERDVRLLDRTMASMRLDFERLVREPMLAELVADCCGRSHVWFLGVAAERGFPTAAGLAQLRRNRAPTRRRKDTSK